MMGNFPEILKVNRLFLRLGWFICNWLSVLPVHRLLVEFTLKFLILAHSKVSVGGDSAVVRGSISIKLCSAGL
jgi:hypothetical protein